MTFVDASGKTSPKARFDVVGGSTNGGGMGSTLVQAGVQLSDYIPNREYWRQVGRNMKFSFLSFGFEDLDEQNVVDIKCRIRLNIDPYVAAAGANGDGSRTLGDFGFDDDYYTDDVNSAEWGAYDYFDDEY